MNGKTLSCALFAAVALVNTARAADHREAPLIREDATADIADVYAFPNPNDPDWLVLAMTVNPLSVPSENNSYAFSPNVRYTFLIDNNGDAQPDKSVRVTFSDPAMGPQDFSVKVSGFESFSGEVTPATVEPDPVEPIIVDGPDGMRAFAGQRDDPFFFDVVGFNRFLAGTGGFDGTDGFAGDNVSAIVVELPVHQLAGDSGNLQIWGVTERRLVTLRRAFHGQLEVHFGPWQQVERMGNPAINTALIPLDLKDFFNIGRPADDADEFAAEIVASLQALGTNDENIAILASVAVPDTLKLDPNQDVGYPNGRGLDDDVIDTLLFFIFNQTPVSDMVDGNDRDFLDEFPYLAPPHQPR